MPVAKPVFFWSADVAVSVSNIAFSLNMKDEKEGAMSVRRIWSDWFKDGIVLWNPSQRAKGWLKAVSKDIRPSMAEQVQGAVKISPSDGKEPIPIAKVSDLVGAEYEPATGHAYRIQEGVPYPYFKHILNQKGQSIPIYWLVLPGPVEVSLKIHSFARSISPEAVKELMEKLGGVVGWGDMTSRGYGLFELKKFESEQVRLAI